MVHSVSRCTRGVQVKLWDPFRTRAISEHLRGVFTTRRYTNPRLPYLYFTNPRLLLAFGNSILLFIPDNSRPVRPSVISRRRHSVLGSSDGVRCCSRYNADRLTVHNVQVLTVSPETVWHGGHHTILKCGMTAPYRSAEIWAVDFQENH